MNTESRTESRVRRLEEQTSVVPDDTPSDVEVYKTSRGLVYWRKGDIWPYELVGGKGPILLGEDVRDEILTTYTLVPVFEQLHNRVPTEAEQADLLDRWHRFMKHLCQEAFEDRRSPNPEGLTEVWDKIVDEGNDFDNSLFRAFMAHVFNLSNNEMPSLTGLVETVNQFHGGVGFCPARDDEEE